jgi:hypothetical protein
MRRVLKVLIDGLGPGVDAYLGLLLPGCDTLSFVGLSDDATCHGRKMERPTGASWKVIGNSTGIYVADVFAETSKRESGLGLHFFEEGTVTRQGAYMAVPVVGLVSSGVEQRVLGVLAVDCLLPNDDVANLPDGKTSSTSPIRASFRSSPLRSPPLGNAAAVLMGAAAVAGDWLQDYRHLCARRAVRQAVANGARAPAKMYSAAVEGLQSVVLDATLFVATAKVIGQSVFEFPTPFADSFLPSLFPLLSLISLPSLVSCSRCFFNSALAYFTLPSLCLLSWLISCPQR